MLIRPNPPLGSPPQAPAPGPVPPQVPPVEPERFDLSVIDTPVEALLMPGVDLLAGLAASQLSGNNPARQPTVRLEVGEQVVEYRSRPDPQGMLVEGQMNGQPFTLQARGNSWQAVAEGDTPGGHLRESFTSIPGGLCVEGRAGAVAFNQMFSLDPMVGLTGHVGDLAGLVGPDPLTVSLNLGADGSSVRATGLLGQRPVAETIASGPNGTVIIEGTIGATAFRQTLTPPPA